MVTGCKPTSVRFTELLKSSTAYRKVVELTFILKTLSKFLEGSFEPNLISKYLTSFEVGEDAVRR